MCINFFKKFFENSEWEAYLITTLRNLDVPIKSDKIKNAGFEYEPDHIEGTNFDFYMEMENGSHLSFEIKYTETDFGGIKPDKKDPKKYDRKWDEIYSKKVNECPFLNCDEGEFYGYPRKKYYQINRNICYAHDKDAVLFLTPRANDSKGIIRGREYIESITKNSPNIRHIYWECLVEELLVVIADSDSDLKEYYEKFKKKYIDVLNNVSI